MSAVRLLLDHARTPIGPFAIVADEAGRLRAAGFTDGHARMERLLRRHAEDRAFSLESVSNPGGLTTALDRYFSGDLAAIEGLPVAPAGTAFQRAVWRGLRDVPCGETWSYARLARHIGHPTAMRAVGLANGANPIAIVVPCHRVVGSNGTLTGYASGIERKGWLLAHEGRGRAPPCFIAPAQPSARR
jgi:methylated-DNA-[protein]-cysteine S-methyltransferase